MSILVKESHSNNGTQLWKSSNEVPEVQENVVVSVGTLRSPIAISGTTNTAWLGTFSFGQEIYTARASGSIQLTMPTTAVGRLYISDSGDGGIIPPSVSTKFVNIALAPGTTNIVLDGLTWFSSTPATTLFLYMDFTTAPAGSGNLTIVPTTYSYTPANTYVYSNWTFSTAGGQVACIGSLA